MEKLANYIKNGKGLGFLFLLAASVIMTIFIMLSLKQVYADVSPQVTKIANEILPIVVKEGQIVSPENVYKKFDIHLGNYDNKIDVFPVVFDTQNESTMIPKTESGIFIMRDVIYLIMQDEVRRISFKDGEFNQSMFEEKINSFLGFSSLVVATIMILLFFVFTLVKTLILILLGKLLLKVKQPINTWATDVLVRLSAVVVAGIELLCFCLSLFGLPITWLYQFIVEIILVWLFINQEVKGFINK